MRIFALFCLLGLTACVPPSVISTGTSGEHQTITLKYLPVPGMTEVTQNRRNEAIAKAKEYCGGQVMLLNETDTPETKAFMPVGSYGMPVTQRWMYVQFECIDKKAEPQIY